MARKTYRVIREAGKFGVLSPDGMLLKYYRTKTDAQLVAKQFNAALAAARKAGQFSF